MPTPEHHFKQAKLLLGSGAVHQHRSLLTAAYTVLLWVFVLGEQLSVFAFGCACF